jgi:hypothetical protein
LRCYRRRPSAGEGDGRLQTKQIFDLSLENELSAEAHVGQLPWSQLFTVPACNNLGQRMTIFSWYSWTDAS